MMVNKRLHPYLNRILACICIIVCLFLPVGRIVAYGAEQTEYSYVFEENKYLFGSQMDEDAQYFYLELLKNLRTPTEKAFSIPIDGRDTRNINTSMIDAIGALFQDFPEYQWLKLGGGSKVTSFETSLVNNVVTKLVFYPVISDQYKSVTAIIKEQTKVEEVLDELISNMPAKYDTRYERLRYIHDYLVKTVTYDTSQKGSKIHSAAGALINKLSVCEGYAKAFKLACEKIGVPCQLVISDSHMWNYVQMENGSWYLVDVTFDDPLLNGTSNYKDGKNIVYDYFLKGSKSMANSKDHKATGSLMVGGTSFTYQTLAKQDYDKSKAKSEALTLYKEGFNERFLEDLTTPVFADVKKTLYSNKTYSQSITKLSGKAKINYSSSNKAVATVSNNGIIKALAAGSCKITTTILQGGQTYTHILDLTVKEPSLTFSKTVTELPLGTTFQFKAKKQGITDSVTWSVDDTSVAIIYKGGTLKPLKEGSIVVTARAGENIIHMTVKITK